ncbi:MAG: MFS transporter [Bacteroidia bacterium]
MKKQPHSGPDSVLSGAGVLAVAALLFFIAGLIASQNELLNPLFKSTFSLKHAESALIQFVYYGVFVLLAIPLGRLAERFGYRRCLQLGLFTAGAGAVLFLFASQAGMFGFFLLGVMVIATGNATLVILGNPYLSIISPPEKSAQRLNLINGFYMVGTTVGPILGTVLYVADVKKPAFRGAGAPYLMLAGILLLFGILITRIHLPPATNPDSTSPHVHLFPGFNLWKDKRLLLGVVTMFMYVGAEVGAASKLVDWLMLDDIMGLDQERAGDYLSIYWGLTMVMRFGAALLMHRIKAVYFLLFSAVLGLALVLFAVTGSGYPAGLALVLRGSQCHYVPYHLCPFHPTPGHSYPKGKRLYHDGCRWRRLNPDCDRRVSRLVWTACRTGIFSCNAMQSSSCLE